MSNYGRNFEFRVHPHSVNRSGRHYNAEGADLPIGVPVVVDTTADENALGLSPVVLADEDAARPLPGEGGILVYEYGPAAFAGYDPLYTTYSDLDFAPDGDAVQMVNGEYVKVLLRNTEDRTFLNSRTYTGRTMVDGIGATPTVAVGDYLTPGDGSNEYWKETSDVADAWLVVTKVDTDRGEVEARVLF